MSQSSPSAAMACTTGAKASSSTTSSSSTTMAGRHWPAAGARPGCGWRWRLAIDQRLVVLAMVALRRCRATTVQRVAGASTIRQGQRWPGHLPVGELGLDAGGGVRCLVEVDETRGSVQPPPAAPGRGGWIARRCASARSCAKFSGRSCVTSAATGGEQGPRRPACVTRQMKESRWP